MTPRKCSLNISILISLLESLVGFAEKSNHYCKVPNSKRHEFCKCKGTNGGNQGMTCNDLCKYDNQCKGYEWWMSGEFCRYYTPASCPEKCREEGKINIGIVGAIGFEKSPGRATCAIKIDGNHCRRLGLQTLMT